MHWAMVGWSHHQTPVELRERLAFDSSQVVDTLQRIQTDFPDTQSVLLSTCNRVELYCAGASELPSAESLAKFLSEQRGCSYDEVKEHLTTHTGRESIRHLFMVAASLDSMVVGEVQILSQVKTAYETASQNHRLSSQMHQAFQRAVTVAKRVSNETEIHKRRVSIPSIAVSEIATEFFERFDSKKILLVGAGEMGMETLKYLQEAGAKNITIVNRSAERGEALAEEFGAVAAPWTELHPLVASADLVVSTTAASEPIMTLADLKAARAKKSGMILILDLAVPRDFEAGISDLSDVYLFSIDDLQQVCDRNIEARKSQWPKAMEIVEQETEKFLSEQKHRGSGDTIKQLREQALAIKQAELERLLKRLQDRGLDEATQKELEIAFDRLVNKILHPPLQSLREHAETDHHRTLLDALRRLFQLKDV